MTDFAAMSHKQRLLHLAVLEVDCQSCSGMGGNDNLPPEERYGPIDGCANCHCTGKVPRFPMLRLACPDGYLSTSGRMHHNSYEFGKCETCLGRGWVPVQTLEALVEAADTLPVVIRNSPPEDEQRWQVGIGWNGATAKDTTLAEALSLALCRAVEGEK